MERAHTLCVCVHTRACIHAVRPTPSPPVHLFTAATFCLGPPFTDRVFLGTNQVPSSLCPLNCSGHKSSYILQVLTRLRVSKNNPLSPIVGERKCHSFQTVLSKENFFLGFFILNTLLLIRYMLLLRYIKWF